MLMQPDTGPCADTAGISAGTAGAASAPGGTGCATLPASCPLLGFQPLGGHPDSPKQDTKTPASFPGPRCSPLGRRWCRASVSPSWQSLTPPHPGHGTPRLQRCCPPLLAHPQCGRTPFFFFLTPRSPQQPPRAVSLEEPRSLSGFRGITGSPLALAVPTQPSFSAALSNRLPGSFTGLIQPPPPNLLQHPCLPRDAPRSPAWAGAGSSRCPGKTPESGRQPRAKNTAGLRGEGREDWERGD